MADNILPEVVEHEQELDSRFRIPNEVFTSVFKLLPRSILVQKVAPASYRFKAICDKNVKNVHVIKQADRFIHKLEENDEEAKKQLEFLAANDCSLASQFRITNVDIDENEESKVVIRHCLDAGLLQGCRISICPWPSWRDRNNLAFIKDCLTHLEQIKPVLVEIDLRHDSHSEPDPLIRHPTVCNCTRIDLTVSKYTYVTNSVMTLFEWLHQKPVELDGLATSANPNQQVRCLILSNYYERRIDQILELFVQDFQLSKVPTDRRQFVFSFGFSDGNGFENKIGRIENEKTGETLELERVPKNDGHYEEYRLRRCLTEEVEKKAEFYAQLFKQDHGYDAFNIDKSGTTEVELMMTDWMDAIESYADDLRDR